MNRFLVPLLIAIFSVAVIGVGIWFSVWQSTVLLDAFFTNPYINGVIGAGLIIGVAVALFAHYRAGREAVWLSLLKKELFEAIPTRSILSPTARLLRTSQVNQAKLCLSPQEITAVLDQVAERQYDTVAFARFMANMLILLGLIGTFWGLLATIRGIADILAVLPQGNASLLLDRFTQLQSDIQEPLSGMATAFSSSLFGLSGSLLLTLLVFLATMSHRRLYFSVENTLNERVKLPGVPDLNLDEDPFNYRLALLSTAAKHLEDDKERLNEILAERRDNNRRIDDLNAQIAILTESIRSIGRDPAVVESLNRIETTMRATNEEMATNIAHTTLEIRRSTEFWGKVIGEATSQTNQTLRQTEKTLALLEAADRSHPPSQPTVTAAPPVTGAPTVTAVPTVTGAPTVTAASTVTGATPVAIQMDAADMGDIAKKKAKPTGIETTPSLEEGVQASAPSSSAAWEAHPGQDATPSTATTAAQEMTPAERDTPPTLSADRLSPTTAGFALSEAELNDSIVYEEEQDSAVDQGDMLDDDPFAAMDMAEADPSYFDANPAVADEDDFATLSFAPQSTVAPSPKVIAEDSRDSTGLASTGQASFASVDPFAELDKVSADSLDNPDGNYAGSMDDAVDDMDGSNADSMDGIGNAGEAGSMLDDVDDVGDAGSMPVAMDDMGGSNADSMDEADTMDGISDAGSMLDDVDDVGDAGSMPDAMDDMGGSNAGSMDDAETMDGISDAGSMLDDMDGVGSAGDADSMLDDMDDSNAEDMDGIGSVGDADSMLDDMDDVGDAGSMDDADAMDDSNADDMDGSGDADSMLDAVDDMDDESSTLDDAPPALHHDISEQALIDSGLVDDNDLNAAELLSMSNETLEAMIVAASSNDISAMLALPTSKVADRHQTTARTRLKRMRIPNE
ncbi:MAG: hypothetical protein K0U36_04660, partial [Alphaproteobacteria bacterium]|nr:hypothetical protein [Alphaproteobacteria bacterium]